MSNEYGPRDDPVAACPECKTLESEDPDRETLETTSAPSAKMKCGNCGNVWVWTF